MAYPSVDAAYGFKAVNELNGLPYAGAIRQIPIVRSYGTAIFNGDLVEFAAGVAQITGMSTSTTTTVRAGQVGVLNRAAYCSAKAGVLGLTKSIAIDYASHNIRCNALLPGTIDSPWIGKILAQQADPVGERARMEARQPIGRMGHPDEIAAAALYLCSDEGSYATGTGLEIGRAHV